MNGGFSASRPEHAFLQIFTSWLIWMSSLREDGDLLFGDGVQLSSSVCSRVLVSRLRRTGPHEAPMTWPENVSRPHLLGEVAQGILLLNLGEVEG